MMQDTYLIIGTMSLLWMTVPPGAHLGLTPGSGGTIGSWPLFKLRQLLLLQLDEPKEHQHPHVIMSSGMTARIPTACHGITCVCA